MWVRSFNSVLVALVKLLSLLGLIWPLRYSEDDIVLNFTVAFAASVLLWISGQALAVVQPDADGDGLSDEQEIAYGTDPNDPDTDSDGISDGEEVNKYQTSPVLADTDEDGLTDTKELFDFGTNPLLRDTDGDGLSDGYELNDWGTDPLNPDTDNNGISDSQDSAPVILEDSDGDGITDSIESQLGTDPLNPDTDSDGASDIDELISGGDPVNPDTDGDGIFDGGESVSVGGQLITDSDGDGLGNAVDLDSDHDGLPDSVEGLDDPDGDNLANSFDLDSDNDGIPDLLEAGGVDVDGDGRVDNFEDLNSDGIADSLADQPLPNSDSDADGVADALDLDSDNDGIADLIESGGVDADGDGRVDTLVDLNDDGLTEDSVITSESDADTDSDGVPDRLDLDSDDDGIADLLEAGNSDANGDQRVDNFIDTNSDGFDDELAATSLLFVDGDAGALGGGEAILLSDGSGVQVITGLQGYGCVALPAAFGSHGAKVDLSLIALMLAALAGLRMTQRAPRKVESSD